MRDPRRQAALRILLARPLAAATVTILLALGAAGARAGASTPFLDGQNPTLDGQNPTLDGQNPTLSPGAAGAPAGDQQNPHAQALRALNDLDAAVDDLNTASGVTEHASEPDKGAARRALDALVGASGGAKGSGSSHSGDAVGAIGRLQWLAANAGPAPWKSAVQRAEENASAAKARLQEAIGADDSQRFRLAAASALEALLVALGHDSDVGPLAGLRGALATTSLGVPEGAMMVSGCTAPVVRPNQTPAYGVQNGYLTFVVVSDYDGAVRLPESIGVRDISVKNGMAVVHTAAINKIDTICPEMARESRPGGGDQFGDFDPGALMSPPPQPGSGQQGPATGRNSLP